MEKARRVIRIENMEVNVFGQKVKVEPFEISFDKDKDLLQGFESLEKAYKEGSFFSDYIMDKFWDNTYIINVPKFVDVEEQKVQDIKACNLYLK